MFGLIRNQPAAEKDHAACSGCSLCLLVCPVWRNNRDLALTPHGRAKALQHGVSVAELAASTLSCTLCAACEPVCPEKIGLIGMVLDLRRQLGPPSGFQAPSVSGLPFVAPRSSSTLLIPDHALREAPDILRRIAALLNKVQVGDDDGVDISVALESGAPVAEQRLQGFLKPLRRLKKIIIADGLLLRHLRQWLPGIEVVSLGESLSGHAGVRRSLRATDLYVIEPRAYHADYQRLVKYYDRLRTVSGCSFNLDLQRIAIPAAAPNLLQRLGLAPMTDDGQARWILHGREVSRIVVENLDDKAVFEKVSDRPIVHLAELAEMNGNPARA